MAESTQHQRLIGRILEYIELNFRDYQSLIVLNDLPTLIGDDKPPRLGGFTPDVYAVDVPATLTIVGEAKTAKDIETDHSFLQFTAFIAHLRSQPSGLLVVSVPWQHTGVAHRVIKQAIKSHGGHISTVEFIILNEAAEYNIQWR